MQIFKSLTKQIEKIFAEIKKELLSYFILRVSVFMCQMEPKKTCFFFKLILTDICSYII